jgi:hypothetical protein
MLDDPSNRLLERHFGRPYARIHRPSGVFGAAHWANHSLLEARQDLERMFANRGRPTERLNDSEFEIAGCAGAGCGIAPGACLATAPL